MQARAEQQKSVLAYGSKGRNTTKLIRSDASKTQRGRRGSGKKGYCPKEANNQRKEVEQKTREAKHGTSRNNKNTDD